MNNEVFMLQNARYVRVNRKKAKKAYNDGATVIIAPVYANMYYQGAQMWIMVSKIELFKRYDEVIDFELTSNRGDLLSILGMAYELGAIYDKPVKEIDLSECNTYEELKNKMKTVIDLTVDKLNDLTNLRGLVMAEVSELDMIMKEIISKYFFTVL